MLHTTAGCSGCISGTDLTVAGALVVTPELVSGCGYVNIICYHSPITCVVITASGAYGLVFMQVEALINSDVFNTLLQQYRDVSVIVHISNREGLEQQAEMNYWRYVMDSLRHNDDNVGAGVMVSISMSSDSVLILNNPAACRMITLADILTWSHEGSGCLNIQAKIDLCGRGMDEVTPISDQSGHPSASYHNNHVPWATPIKIVPLLHTRTKTLLEDRRVIHWDPGEILNSDTQAMIFLLAIKWISAELSWWNSKLQTTLPGESRVVKTTVRPGLRILTTDCCQMTARDSGSVSVRDRDLNGFSASMLTLNSLMSAMLVKLLTTPSRLLSCLIDLRRFQGFQETHELIRYLKDSTKEIYCI